MSVLITQAFVNQYKGNVIQLSQQQGSRLEGYVRVERDVNGFQYFFERLNKTAAVPRLNRHADTPQIDSQHDRRMVTLIDYEWADLIDKEDKVRILINPESEYAQAAAWALGRSKDDVILAAMNGNAFVGQTGTTLSALPATQKIANASAGLTLAKLLQAKYILDFNDVDPAIERYIVVGAQHIQDMLNTTEVKNYDYNTVKALAMGHIDTFVGFKFIMVNRLIGATDGGKSAVMAWARNGVALAIGADMKARVTERSDKSYSVQVYNAMTLGGTRVEDEKVVEVSCND